MRSAKAEVDAFYKEFSILQSKLGFGASPALIAIDMAQGGHGFGVRKSNLPCSTWTDCCVAWRQNQGAPGGKAEAK